MNIRPIKSDRDYEKALAQEAILFRVEQMGIDRKALTPFLGGRSCVSEVLNRKRGLSIKQIKSLHASLRIPCENLLGSA